MADRPIIFSAPMVRALLDGRKTQTRRVLKPQPPRQEDFPHSPFCLSRCVAEGVKLYSQNDYDRLPKHPTRWEVIGSVGVVRDAGFPLIYDTRFAAGDRLWVREAVRADEHEEEDQIGVRYLADDWWMPLPDTEEARERHYVLRCYRSTDPDLDAYKPVPPIHMPRWASRITLVVTDVRVQRLREISEEDACEEGAPHLADSGATPWGDGFADIWNSLHGGDAWQANPWVVALTFNVHRRNIDDGGAVAHA